MKRANTHGTPLWDTVTNWLSHAVSVVKPREVCCSVPFRLATDIGIGCVRTFQRKEGSPTDTCGVVVASP